ncbi:putative protein T-ENOL [Lepus europaeus]|uniref:putative protein T-ENOL n=1 Tax=Lepus europaeus TaxID=9983 RepID=UPI002B495BBC|nr:putative protein T-ENOL [Lepus europaeus]
MASAPARNEEKGSRLAPAPASLSEGPLSSEGETLEMGVELRAPRQRHPSQKVSLSRSEEFLTRISTELTDEALFIACCHMNPVPIKEKQTKDQGTQISQHVFCTKTRGTDTRSDRNRTRTKAHLLPSPRAKTVPPSSPFATR